MNILQKQLVTTFTLLLACSFYSCNVSADPVTDSQRLFFEKLSNACGERFKGYSNYPDDPNHPFAGQLLVAHLATCNDNEIRIPFFVGEDHSRTWIIRSDSNGLSLKHDHRHADGQPDEITNYGGTSVKTGSEYSQAFPADAFTAQLIPDAATNVWALSLSKDGQELTYYLERDNEPRFKATLQVQSQP